MGGVVTEEKDIACDQYLDLVYSHLENLYDLIPHAPHPTTDPSQPTTQSPVDGLVGLVTNQLGSKSSGNLYQKLGWP